MRSFDSCMRRTTNFSNSARVVTTGMILSLARFDSSYFALFLFYYFEPAPRRRSNNPNASRQRSS
jgi:hypothetical protein